MNSSHVLMKQERPVVFWRADACHSAQLSILQDEEALLDMSIDFRCFSSLSPLPQQC